MLLIRGMHHNPQQHDSPCLVLCGSSDQSRGINRIEEPTIGRRAVLVWPREHVSSKFGQSAVPEPDQQLTADWLNSTCTAHQAALGLSEEQVAAIVKLPRVAAKAARLAGCLRALRFLERYSSDLSGRDVRLAELAKQMRASFPRP